MIPSRERLIVALDVPDIPAARALVKRLGDAVVFYKIGLELFMGAGFFEFLDELRAQNKKVFVDLKFFDIPETVARAVRSLAERGADFCTVHGNQAIMEAIWQGKPWNSVLKDLGDALIYGFSTAIPFAMLWPKATDVLQQILN